MIGQRLAQYVIVERIGAGGMGEVYRARDERLERDVAIKVLPAGTLTDEAARRRFRQEALALARLNHPHIATIHDFNSQEGVDFLVMEHVPGSSLAEKLATGPLSEKETLRLGTQVAAALEEAHAQRIVHRDLKPGNIVLTSRGDVKVLDFGLAKLLQPAEGEAVTAESFAETRAGAGTLPYMAPEQLRGEPVDARTDIHALGAVLYEMSTGQRPFPETQGPRLIDAILNSAPAAPGRFQPRLSAELERIILKCLEKDPERRYQSARELRVDLERLAAPSAAVVAPVAQPSGARRWVIAATAIGALLLAVLLGFNVGGLRERLLGRTGATQIQSLAVLPLENLSGDPEQEYFVDGMHEELIARLAKISALKVISRTSVTRYKGERKPPLPEIGRELGVDAVIEGSVRRSGDQVRITVQLIEAATDKHLWAESYQGDLRDVLALQSDVAQAIADEIRIALTARERASLSGAGPVNPQAYEAYLKGRFYWNKRSSAGLLKGIEYFNEAIQQDPNNALAYAGLADSYSQLAYRGHSAPSEAYPRATATAKKALEINSDLAEAHAAMGFIRFNYDWDWPGAEREFRLALKLNPSYAEAHHWYSHYLIDTGRVEESLAESKRALEFDPLSLIVNTHLGVHYLFARQCDLAVEQLKKTVEMDPSFYSAHLKLGQAYQCKGAYRESVAELQQAKSLSGDVTETVAALAVTYARSGNKDEAVKLMGELKRMSQRTYVSPYDIATIYTALGDKNQALAWLEKAYQQRANGLVELKVEPAFDPLRSDPRYHDLLRRVGLPPD